MSPFPLPFHLPPGVSPMANGASPFSANGAYPNFGVFNSPDLQVRPVAAGLPALPAGPR